MNNEVKHNIREYVLGGKAEFTIVQDPSGSKGLVMAKYRVQQSKDRNRIYFVYAEDAKSGLLSYHGYITTYNNAIKYHRAKTMQMKSKECYNEDSINALMWVLERGDNLPSKVHLVHSGTCSRCGRVLTDFESIQYGLGPECRKKMGL